jgi:predicted metal-dependent hydrolase
MKVRAVSTENAHRAEKWADADDMKSAVRHWSARIGVQPGHIHVRQMRAKWASISTAGRLTLNADLLSVPKRLGEYVIVHELVHLLAPNHGKVFKSFLLAYMSDWKERERELQEYAGVESGAGDGRI